MNMHVYMYTCIYVYIYQRNLCGGAHLSAIYIYAYMYINIYR